MTQPAEPPKRWEAPPREGEEVFLRYSDLYDELVVLQRDLARKNAALERANAHLAHLLRTVAHDIRTPIQAIRLYAEALLGGEGERLSEPASRSLRKIGDATRFMQRLIEALLDVSVMEVEGVPLTRVDADLVPLLRDAIVLHEGLASRKAIRIETALADRLPGRFDPTRVEQVVNNLLANAIAYTPPGGRVRIEAVVDAGELEVRVSDDGPGIPREEQPQLFRPFPAISTKATAGERRTGLGLAIARAIVEAHQGTIWVSSEVGRGSTFGFRLPAGAPG